ncbi:hypothetical protein [Sphingobacterium athyrii]|nr:hypothetical protein [Sphingobacterium athyrii]
MSSQLGLYEKKIKQKAWKSARKLPIFAPLRKGGTVTSKEEIMKKEGFNESLTGFKIPLSLF